MNQNEKSTEAVVAACTERRAERGGKQEVMFLKRAWHQKLVRRDIKQEGLGRLAIPIDNLNFSNRPVRTRMPGGVGGATPYGASPIPITWT